MEKSELLSQFIRKHTIGVISTVGTDGVPESAVVEFGQTEDLELIFETFTHTRKYKNLQKNKQVSFVIGWEDNKTIQYQGVAQEISTELTEKEKLAYWANNEKAQRWEMRDGVVYFKVTPTWIRYTDVGVTPWETVEMTF